MNFNVESTLSDPLVRYSCVAPSQPQKPIRVGGTKTDITLKWAAPSNNGGCPITGFKLWRDLGAGGSISTEVDPANINDKPYLNEYPVSLTASDTGKVFKF